MKRHLAVVLVLGCSAYAVPSTIPGLEPVPGNPNLLASGIPPIPRELKSRVSQYQNTRSATVLDLTDDGSKALISTRFGSTAQLHLVEQPLGARYQLTFTEEPINTARFVPGDPMTIFYGQDVGGGEFFQLYRFDRRTGQSELLTDGQSRHDSLIISKDGKKLAYSGTGRNGKDTDVYVSETRNPREAKRITELAGTWHPVDFSPRDSNQLLVSQQRSSRDADLYLVNLATGEKHRLTPKEGGASVHLAHFTADGAGVYFVTDRYSNFNELYRLDLQRPGGAPLPLSRSIPWDVERIAIAPDGSRVAAEFNQDGFSVVQLLDVKTGKLAPLNLPKGVISNIRFPLRRSNLITLTLSTSRSTSDVWQYDLTRKKLTRWTRSELGALTEDTFVEPSLVRYPSTDGVSVPAFVYRPAKRSAGRSPVIIVWHGGPEGQSRPVFSPFAQLLVAELQSAVLYPNVRGSRGYGKDYLDMDNGVKREGSLADIGRTLDWIATQPDLDPAKVGVYGGSYGGYMVLATAAFFPTRIRAAVDVVGVSRLSSLLENTSPYRQDLRRAEYGDERIPGVRTVLERISPLNKADAIQAALFVQQGKNDPRVPMSESEQIVRAVRARGKDVWYLLGENEGHGFRKKENQDFATQATVLFFREKLVGGTTATLPPRTEGVRAVQ